MGNRKVVWGLGRATSLAIGMKLSRKRQRWFKEVMLSGQTITQKLGGCPSCTQGFEHEPFCGGVSPPEEGVEGGRGRKEQVEPAVGQRLLMTDEFE